MRDPYVHDVAVGTQRTWRDVRLESVMRFKADIGERNTGLLKGVKLNRGRPMAMASQDD